MSRVSTAIRAILAAGAIFSAGCDDAFDPVVQSDMEFSVFGHLDASADTQWIRVMPLRSVIFTTPEPPGISVTLEELGTGRLLDVRDSLTVHGLGGGVGSAGVFVHNFWTADRIVPGETYRFTAIGPNGESATATLPIPADYSVTVAIRQGTPVFGARLFDEVRIGGVDHLAFVRVYAAIRLPIAPPPAPPECDGFVHVQERRYEIVEPSTDPHTVSVTRAAGFPYGCTPQIVEKQDLWIVGSGSPWPRHHITDPIVPGAALGVTDLPSNVTNSVGFLGGVHTKVIPYESCEIVGEPPIPYFCELAYGAEKASLSGTVFDACGNRPLPDASVRLEEIEADAAGHHRVRTSPTGLLGGFRIASLNPGARYHLTVLHPHPQHMPLRDNADFPDYIAHTDTLQFSPGEQATLNVTLKREGPC